MKCQNEPQKNVHSTFKWRHLNVIKCTTLCLMPLKSKEYKIILTDAAVLLKTVAFRFIIMILFYRAACRQRAESL